MYRSFRKNPDFLAKYHIKSTLVILALDALLFAVHDFRTEKLILFIPAFLLLISPDVLIVSAGFVYALGVVIATQPIGWAAAALIPISWAWALAISALLHNASHDNLKPRWLCRLVGEFTGLCQMVGFPDWAILHVIHHAHSDDPEKDPHPPGTLSFWKYLMGMRANVMKVFLKEYFALWGQTPKSMAALKLFARVSKVEQMAKVVFWYLLLGPTVFTLFFVSSIVFKMIHFPWVNYVTHQSHHRTGEIENIDGGWYRVLNFFTWGLYAHKNHHLNPRLFDPRKFVERQEPTNPAEKAG